MFSFKYRLNGTPCTIGQPKHLWGDHSETTHSGGHAWGGMFHQRKHSAGVWVVSLSSYCIERQWSDLSLVAKISSGTSTLCKLILKYNETVSKILVILFLSIYSLLKTRWRCGSANMTMGFTEFRNTIETITSNNHIKQKSGSRIWYSQ